MLQPSDQRLDDWATEQRLAYKAYKCGIRGSSHCGVLTPEKIAALEAIPGWTWVVRDWVSHEEAKTILKPFGLKNTKEFYALRKERKLFRIPTNPAEVYMKEWRGMADFLGHSDRKKWTRALVLTELREFHREHKRSASYNECPAAQAGVRLFGTLNNALLAAGLKPNRTPAPWRTKKSVIEEIKKIYSKTGKVPTTKTHQCLCTRAIRLLGTWTLAVTIAKLTPARCQWSKEDVIKFLQMYYRQHGKNPSSRENIRMYGAAQKWFGGWMNAVKSAGLNPVNLKLENIKDKRLLEAKIFMKKYGFIPMQRRGPKSALHSYLKRHLDMFAGFKLQTKSGIIKL